MARRGVRARVQFGRTPAGHRFARLVAMLGAAACVAPPAAAQEPGVFVDPDSPAGKEYAIPFEEGRRLGGGDGVPDGTGRPTPPSFGVGIEPNVRQGGDARDGGAPSAPSGDRSGKRAGRDRSDPIAGIASLPRGASAGEPPAGGGPWLWLAALSAGVLAIGFAAGSVARSLGARPRR